MDNQQESKQDRRLADYSNWFNISETNGWLVYKRELEELIQKYAQNMDNQDAPEYFLKNCQLVKKGLKMAFDIPKILENKAKMARKEIK